MVKKPPPGGMQEPEAQYRQQDDGLSETEMDAWGERNKDALQASFEKARADYARGHYYTLEEAVARAQAKIKRVAKKA